MDTNATFSELAKHFYRRFGPAPSATKETALRAPKALLVTLSLLGALCALGACGGSALDDADDGHAHSSGVVKALMDDEGYPMPNDPDTAPKPPAQQHPALRYASAAQAQQLEEAMGAQSVLLELYEGGPAALASALNQVIRAQTEQAAPANMPVFVRARDLQHASDVALRLGEMGLVRVWVVTQ